MATVASVMTDITPSSSHKGPVTADDMVFGLGIGGATTVGSYLVADDGVTEASGALEAQTQDSNYLRRGQVTTKTGTTKTFTVSGDRIDGDAFQDAILAHAVKYGTGSSVIFPYVYFNGLTGVGEKGNVSVQVEDDYAGAASENAKFSVSCTTRGTPEPYTYTPPTP